MPDIFVIAVGKIKEKFIKDALSEYEKRLLRFCNFKFIELPDRPIPENASEKEELAVTEREGEEIISKIPKGSFVISLCVEGKSLSSEEFAGTLSDIFMTHSSVAFLIGGSLGLSEEAKKKSLLRLSMSKMTFPHNLARLILTEQIYRAFKIMGNETYHK